MIGLQQADLIISIPTILTVGLAPVCAIIFDRLGKRGFGLVLGFIVLIFGNLVFMLGQCSPNSICYAQYMPMILLGVGDCVIQIALYTGFTYVVPEKSFNIAFGVLTAFQSVGMVCGTIITGLVLSEQQTLNLGLEELN